MRDYSLKQAVSILIASAAVLSAAGPATPVYDFEVLFPKEKVHNHSSMIVELPDGSLFAVWYRGSGERQADDVQLMYARKKGTKACTKPAVLADTPGFPDCNPTVFVDSKKRLWLAWPLIVANEWHTALLKYKISSDYMNPSRPPKWDVTDEIMVAPRNFAQKSLEVLEPMKAAAKPGSEEAKWVETMIGRAKDKYFSRMGWMPRAHFVELPSGRIILPLYSDGYDYSLMAITDDGGQTWTTSEPLVSNGGIQPSIVRKKNGALVTYMRDNGPPPKRLLMSESTDAGITWSPVRDSELPNPGSGAEAITLADGRWALAFNDTEKGRHSLAVAISDDEGATWKWKRHLELEPGSNFGYPSLVQGRNGIIHATYSHTDKFGQTIKYARFNTAWVEAGDK